MVDGVNRCTYNGDIDGDGRTDCIKVHTDCEIEITSFGNTYPGNCIDDYTLILSSAQPPRDEACEDPETGPWLREKGDCPARPARRVTIFSYQPEIRVTKGAFINSSGHEIRPNSTLIDDAGEKVKIGACYVYYNDNKNIVEEIRCEAYGTEISIDQLP